MVALRLVTAAGEVLDLDAGVRPRGLSRGAAFAGALGVIAAVTIECVPLYTLHRHDLPAPLGETLDRLDEHVETNDHFEFFVFPYTGTALTRRTRRSDEEPEPPPAWKRSVQEQLLENDVLSPSAVPGGAPRASRRG